MSDNNVDYQLFGVEILSSAEKRAAYAHKLNVPSASSGAVSSSSYIWLISFSDLMGMMLTFFLMLFAVSSPIVPQVKPADENSVQQQGAEDYAGDTDGISLNRIDYNKSYPVKYLGDIFEKQLKEQKELSSLQVVVDEKAGQLVLVLPEELAFEAGQNTISAKGKNALGKLAEPLARLKNKIEIMGYTDGKPFPPVKNPAENKIHSNWALSLSRAGVVADVLRQSGYSRPIAIRGGGENAKNTLAANLKADSEAALSRRVDIIIRDHSDTARQRFGIAQ